MKNARGELKRLVGEFCMLKHNGRNYYGVLKEKEFGVWSITSEGRFGPWEVCTFKDQYVEDVFLGKIKVRNNCLNHGKRPCN